MSDTPLVKPTLRTVALLAGAGACAAAPWPGLWLSDLLAALAPWIAVAAAALSGGLAITRARRWAILPLALACSTAILTLTTPRAPRTPHAGSARSITILVLNARAAPLAETLGFLKSHNADIVVLVEAPWDLFDSTAQDAGYQWRLAFGPQSGPGIRALLSRWPGDPVKSGPHRGVFGARIHSPHGPIAVVVAHPQSPRTLSRWREGNRRTREAAELASRLQAGSDATLIAADFNSPPTGWRSRLLGRAGFRRAKPLWPPAGSYPAWAPETMALAIDGVAVGRRFSVSSWRALKAPGTDHRAVLVDLAMDGQ